MATKDQTVKEAYNSRHIYQISYWNFPYQPEKYNFAQFAINKGYSIFFYDRLGNGISSK